MPFIDPTSAEFFISVTTEIVSIISAVIFAALYLERRTNAKIQDAKEKVCIDLEDLEKRIKEYIDSKQELSRTRTKYINDTIDRLDKQIERLENMSFGDYYKKFFYPRNRGSTDDDTETLPSK